MNTNRRAGSCITPVILLLVVTAILAILVLAAGWRLGLLTLGKTTKTGQLLVQVQPVGGSVYIDGKLRGQTPYQSEVKSGSHSVRVEQAGFIPLAVSVEVTAGQTVVLDQQMKRVPTTQVTADDAAFPHFAADGGLLYLNIGSGEILSQSSGRAVAGPFYGQVLGISYSPDGRYVAVNVEEGEIPALYMVDLSNGTSREIGIGACPVGWTGPQDAAALCWDAYDSPVKVWRGQAGSTLQPWLTEDFSRALPASWIGFSASGDWLAIRSGNELSLWEVDAAGAAYSSTLSAVQAATWDPVEPNRLIFLDDQNTLRALQVGMKEPVALLADSAGKPLAWMPEGSGAYAGQLLYAVYDAAEGGSAIWAVDAGPGANTLLVDAGVARGRVERLAISPDGRQIAYTTDFNFLQQINFGP